MQHSTCNLHHYLDRRIYKILFAELTIVDNLLKLLILHKLKYTFLLVLSTVPVGAVNWQTNPTGPKTMAAKCT